MGWKDARSVYRGLDAGVGVVIDCVEEMEFHPRNQQEVSLHLLQPELFQEQNNYHKTQKKGGRMEKETILC